MNCLRACIFSGPLHTTGLSLPIRKAMETTLISLSSPMGISAGRIVSPSPVRTASSIFSIFGTFGPVMSASRIPTSFP
ncbi:MAG: hypothetical protein A4E51_01932 [Methanosaeta sp. PtaU1.Bin055]|nr:MAG: hypothetical protein A4E51_01932 [Methanosaeta sp. PtaU1.Bin055]